MSAIPTFEELQQQIESVVAAIPDHLSKHGIGAYAVMIALSTTAEAIKAYAATPDESRIPEAMIADAEQCEELAQKIAEGMGMQDVESPAHPDTPRLLRELQEQHYIDHFELPDRDGVWKIAYGGRVREMVGSEPLYFYLGVRASLERKLRFRQDAERIVGELNKIHRQAKRN